MKKLHVDIETYSEVNLKTDGLYKYAKNCEIILFAYSFDDGPVIVLDLTTPDWDEYLFTDDLREALIDPEVMKYAFNANFEIECISAFFNIKLDRSQWRCVMILSAVAGLPLGLDKVSSILKLDEKDKRGSALIKFFCGPCKPSKTNGERVRNLPQHAPDKWAEFIEYNRQDVIVEKAVEKKLSFIKIPESEHELWALDQHINAVGIQINKTLVYNAIKMDSVYREELIGEAIDITDLLNPNSVQKVRQWLEAETETEIDSLNKDKIPDLISKFDSESAKRILTIRQELSKTSVKKYSTMIRSMGEGERIRGLVQFYGANRTGRFAGRLVQVHNLPKGIYSGAVLDLARNLLLENDREMLEFYFGAIPDTLSQLIRTAFVPAKGHRFLISDFSAIEAVLISWLADQEWRLEIFRTHRKIYEASAAQMFNVPIESVTKTSDYRAKGKISELALGFGGGVLALIKMGAVKMGIDEWELQPLVDAWRAANPKIKLLWKAVEIAAKYAVQNNTKMYLSAATYLGTRPFPKERGITFEFKNKFLLITLPSGRILYYANMQLVAGGMYGDELKYMSMNQVSKRWQREKTYGGKLVENIIQAIARDCLAEALVSLHGSGYRIVMHVHDEVICEMPEGVGSIEEMNELMVKPAPWMEGIPLKAEGFESYYYKKD